jgi:type IV fimbrial biogenesis protein FimT
LLGGEKTEHLLMSRATGARHGGFTMEELLLTFAIFALLLVFGLPNLTLWIQNTNVRTAAESIQNGLQFARTEAVRRNGRMEFVLVSDIANQTNVSAAPDTAGLNWLVRNYQSGGTYTSTDFIQGSGANSTPTAMVTASDATVVFNGLGRTDLAAINTIQITNPSYTCIGSGGDLRCLNVVVQIGGQIRMCDPSVTTVGDTRAC